MSPNHGGASPSTPGPHRGCGSKGTGKPGPRMALLSAPRRQRLLHYCARPIFAGERLTWVKPGQRLAYSLPKPRPDGQIVLYLTPLEWLDRVAVLIPPPRRHRRRSHGVLAPTVLPGAKRDSASWSSKDGPQGGGPQCSTPCGGDGTGRPPRSWTSLGRAGASPSDWGARGAEHQAASPASYLWAMLLARIYGSQAQGGACWARRGCKSSRSPVPAVAR